MKLKYKKLIIIITVATFALAFLILTLIPTGGSPQNVEDARLTLNENQDIVDLVTNYFQAKKTVNMEELSTLVSDSNQINKEKFTALAEYVEDYQNINCYVIENEEENASRVYVKYDMKMKNIDTLVPCLSAFYITGTSDGKYVIYLSALDENQIDFITAADKNMEIVKLKKEVNDGLNAVINQDANFKQLYQKMETQIRAATGSAVDSAPVDPAGGVSGTSVQAVSDAAIQ